MIHIGWPQGIYLAWTVLGILCAGMQHNQSIPRNGWGWLWRSR
jgi:hypothetical protein